MQTNKITILSTRPVGKELIMKAASHDIIIDEVSFISTEKINDNSIDGKIKSLVDEKIIAVFTSMNAVEIVKEFIPSESPWKVFCIGNTTKKTIENTFAKDNILGTADNANRLSEQILQNKNIKKVYFFCGDQRRNELPDKLRSNHVEVEELVVYRTIESQEIISKKYDGVLFFSPSAVTSFFRKNAISNTTQVFAIGNTTANEVKLFTQQPVITADIPGKENLILQVINHFSRTKIS